MTAGDALTWALGEVGQHEDPWGSNRIKYWQEIGLAYLNGFQWCGAFCWDAMSHGKALLDWTTARRFVDTTAGLADAKAEGLFYQSHRPQGAGGQVWSARPRPGDVVWFNTDADPGPEHVGLVYNVSPEVPDWSTRVRMTYIAGNESDRVVRATCALDSPQVLGFAKINYGERRTPTMNLTDSVTLGDYGVETFEWREEHRDSATVAELIRWAAMASLRNEQLIRQLVAAMARLNAQVAEKDELDYARLAKALILEVSDDG
jgi:hypothetical protein